MKRVLTAVLCAFLLVSCTTPAMISPSYSSGYSSNAEYMAANGIVPPEYTPPIPITPTPAPPPAPTPPPTAGGSGWQIAGTILLFPIWFPIVLLAAAPPHTAYTGVHCRSYIYKDAYHTKCY